MRQLLARQLPIMVVQPAVALRQAAACVGRRQQHGPQAGSTACKGRGHQWRGGGGQLMPMELLRRGR